MPSIRHIHLQCTCNNPRHIVRMTLDSYENPPELSVTPELNVYLPWYQRLLVALSYLFNFKYRDKHWGGCGYDTVILTQQGVDDMSNLLVHRRILQKVRRRKEQSSEVE